MLSRTEIGELYQTALKRTNGDESRARRMIEAYLAGLNGCLPRRAI